MSPYVSFIIPARNDNYAGAGTGRLQRSLDVLLEQLQEFRLDSEIVVVEWNPPPDTQPLADALRFGQPGSCVAVRILSVPPRFHLAYRGHAQKGMHGSAAFNAALRRSLGRFAVLRASDTLYTDDVVRRMSERDLDDRVMYRVDRFDVISAAVEASGSGRRHLLDACASAVTLHHARLEMPDYFRIRELHTNACGDFTLMSRDLWFELRGLYEDRSVACLDVDSLALHAGAGLGARQEVWPDPCRVYKPVHGKITALRVKQRWGLAWRLLDAPLRRYMPGYEHNRLRVFLDYPRRTVDGLSGTLPSFERNFLRRAQRWARGEGPFYLNGENWGLAGVALSEKTLVAARWEKTEAGPG